MADNVTISGPVRIMSDSKERVAYDLLSRIINNEAGQGKTRRQILELYWQCHQAVSGYPVDHYMDAPQ